MEEKDPFFSVVIPTYNRAGIIGKSIESVLKQDFKDFELIIADDCSTDGTEEFIKGLNIPFLKFEKGETNKGNAGARNLGIRNSRGKYVTFLDSDDQYHDNFLQKMHDLIIGSNFPGFLWTNVNWIDIEGNVLDHSIPETWEPLKQKDPYLFFLKGLRFGTGYGFTVRRDCFDKTGYFDENLRTAVDTDFILRIVQDFNFNHCKEILVDTYDHVGERVRRDTSEKLKSYNIIIEKHRDTIEKHIELQHRWYHKLMWLNYHNGKKEEARKYLKLSLKAGKYKSALAAGIFEAFPREKAIDLHRKISAAL